MEKVCSGLAIEELATIPAIETMQVVIRILRIFFSSNSNVSLRFQSCPVGRLK
jgi:hypothetical protein